MGGRRFSSHGLETLFRRCQFAVDCSKLCLLQQAASQADKTVFIDTDTFFLHDPALLFAAGSRAEVPIVRDPALVQALYRVPMDTPVSRELFPVMAALIVHVLNVDSVQRGEKKP